jgi:hypothetical protein
MPETPTGVQPLLAHEGNRQAATSVVGTATHLVRDGSHTR